LTPSYGFHPPVVLIKGRDELFIQMYIISNVKLFATRRAKVETVFISITGPGYQRQQTSVSYSQLKGS
jgi:hypothetical protein